MKTSIDIKEEIKSILLTALRNTDCYLFMFGSRVKGKTHDRSDFDIGVLAKKPLGFELMGRLEEYMKAIPALIDVVDFHSTDEDFRSIALKHVEVWKKPKNSKGFKFKL